MTKRLFLLSILIIVNLNTIFEVSATEKIKWQELPELSHEAGMNRGLGLAGSFVGASNDALLVGGGISFSNKVIVDDSKKVYHKSLFVLTRGAKKWHNKFELPYGRTAYGVAVTTPSGVVCAGGTDGKMNFSRAFLMVWHKETDKVLFRDLPDFPATIKFAAGTAVGNKVYVAGGIHNGKLSNDFYVLDLASKGKLNWKKLPPYPGFARKQAVMVSQEGGTKGSIYLFSGCGVSNGKKIAFTDAYVYNTEDETWSSIADIQPAKADSPISLMGATGIKSGTHHILFFGGINTEVFDQTADKIDILKGQRQAASLKKSFTKKNAQIKWNKNVLAYHTVTDTWTVVEEYPYFANFGAGIANFDGGIAIVNGKIMLGIHTPKVFLGKFNHAATFGIVNWTVLIVYLFGMLGIGYYFMLRENGTEDFFKGGGRIPWWAAGVSIFATMLSSISFMAAPAMTYSGTWAIFLLTTTITLSQPIVVKYYLPFFRRLNVTSAYEYLEARFNITCRTLASFTFILFMIVRIGIVSYLPALALEAVTGINIIYCIFGIGIITIIYCTMGGVEAVIWGDFIQGLILIGGALLAFLYICSGVDGGIGEIINIGINDTKFEILNTALDITKPTIWILLIGGTLSNLFTYTSDQSVIQRYITTKDEKSAAKSIWLNAIACIPVSILFCLIGTGLYAYYKTNPELLDVSMNKSDQIFPFFIMQKLPVGLTGLLIAAVFSATMSTLSSNINSAATAITTDFYKRFIKGVTDNQCMAVARISTVLVGVLGIMIAYFLYMMKDIPIFEYFNMIVGLLVSGLGILFLMGIFSKQITGWGAIIGFFVSSVVLFFVKKYTSIHWIAYSIIATISCVVIAYIMSFIFKDKKEIDGLTIFSLKSTMVDELAAKKHDDKINQI